ncbi:MAG: FAD-dependent monooxygenase [Pseudomonadota bacterium]
MKQTDIFISGGGIAGLLAALALGAERYNVTCVDPNPIVDNSDDPLADLRTAAYLQPAQTLLAQLGLWDALEPWATELQIMRLADAGGREGTIREVADFNAQEIGSKPFGWNIPNWRMRKIIAREIEARPNINFIAKTQVTSVFTRDGEARIALSNEAPFTAQLLVGADGRDSFVREAVGIRAKTTRYGQKALVFMVTHAWRHENISTEVHRSGGAFTLVPLPDYKGSPASAVVWMDFSAECDRRMAITDAAFNSEATERSGEVLGDLSIVSRRQSWPIITRRAARLTAERTALIAEAAHVMPPIGAQGLNMSVNDILALKDASLRHGLGTSDMLRDYERAREGDIMLRQTGIDLLNRAAMTRSENLQALRLKGLQTLHGFAPLRRSAMELGLGARQS